MRYQSIPLLIVLVFASACSTVNYESPEFSERASHHETIAVLPFKVVFTGDPPKKATPQQIAHIEEAESVAFQEAYYYRLLHQASVHRKHPIRIDIQPVATTNRLLEEAGIGVRDSWGMSAKALSRVLRVDAVISTSVEKDRYISYGESFGIDMGLQVVNELTEGKLAYVLPWGVAETHDIRANCELIDSLDGAVLWQTDFAQAADWRYPANRVIADFAVELAKRFPYRG